MPPSSEPSRSGIPVLFSAPGLSVVALVLFVLFVSLVAAALFPLQLLDPAWQLRLAGTLINGAPFALLGLALLQIAAELGPHDPQLKNRARLCAQLAVAAALGFLLLLPLQTVAGLQQGRSLNNAQAARIQGAEAKSAPALWVFRRCRHHLPLQTPVMPPDVEGGDMDAELLGNLSNTLSLRWAHTPFHLSFYGLAVTTH